MGQKILALLGLALSVSLAGGQPLALRAAELKPGDAAPEFSLAGTDGKTYKLSDFKGKQAVIIAWFPKAFTPGCTAECKSMHDQGKLLRAFDVAYFTASGDDVETNKKFAQSLDLDYPILSDPSHTVAQEYGVLAPGAKLRKRWTFIIGGDGRILAIDKSVHTATHASDLAAQLKELGIPKRK